MRSRSRLAFAARGGTRRRVSGVRVCHHEETLGSVQRPRRSPERVLSLVSVVFVCVMQKSDAVELPDACGKNKNITLSGGSLGSCVDEERSQLRDLM
jgi:hypothetical protein